MAEEARCELCGEPMPKGEEMFKLHGYSGPCPKPPLPRLDMSFSARNKRRCEAKNGFNHALNSWSMSDWMTALVGEVGEAANIIKKLNRVRDGVPGNKETPEELRANLAEEIADAAIYLDLLAQAAGLDLEQIREAKFAETNRKIGYLEPDLTEHEKRLLGSYEKFDPLA